MDFWKTPNWEDMTESDKKLDANGNFYLGWICTVWGGIFLWNVKMSNKFLWLLFFFLGLYLLMSVYCTDRVNYLHWKKPPNPVKKDVSTTTNNIESDETYSIPFSGTENINDYYAVPDKIVNDDFSTFADRSKEKFVQGVLRESRYKNIRKSKITVDVLEDA